MKRLKGNTPLGQASYLSLAHLVGAAVVDRLLIEELMEALTGLTEELTVTLTEVLMGVLTEGALMVGLMGVLTEELPGVLMEASMTEPTAGSMEELTEELMGVVSMATAPQ
jgi:hypothetical protein